MTNEIPMTVLRINHHNAQHIAARYPYAAYGSNLMMAQINERCPRVELLTGGMLLANRLDFSKVATINEDKESSVPVGLYKLTAGDIDRLDRKEGMGRVYDRFLVTPITDDGRAVRCFTYIKRDNTPEPPTGEYYTKLLVGYRDWRFDDRRLRRARERAIEAWEKAAPARAAADKLLARYRPNDYGMRGASGGPWPTAGEAWAQGEMFDRIEPLGNVTPLHSGRVKEEITLRHSEVEWGTRNGRFFFRKKNTRAWYEDLSDADSIRQGFVVGRLAHSLPGSTAFVPWRKKRDT